MIEPLSVLGGLGQVTDLVIASLTLFSSSARSVDFFLRHYGLAGVILWLFGSNAIWRIQFQILHSTIDQEAMDFKKATQDESSIIALAVSLSI